MLPHSWERRERVRENAENEARRPLLENEQQQPNAGAPSINSTLSPGSNNYDSLQQAALLMAEAARNAQQALASAANAVNPNNQQRGGWWVSDVIQFCSDTIEIK